MANKFSVGDDVYVKTPSHGFVLAKITKIDNGNVSVKYVNKFIKESYGDQEVIYAKSNLSKILPSTSNTVRPLFWSMQNKKDFPKWVYETFKIHSSCDKKNDKKNNKFKFSNEQKFIRDYLGHDSPYRGLLLYHGLGTGKTCAAIALSENLKDTRNIIIMLPATSLHQNFKKQLKVCGDPEYSDDLIKEKYSFITYKSSTAYKQLVSLGNVNNKVIIIDEAHNLATMMASGISGIGKQGQDIYNLLLQAKNTKFVLLTGTPLINKPFELALLLNVIRGLIEVIIFKVLDFDEKTIDNLLKKLLGDNRIGYVDLNRRNQSLTIIMKVNSWDMEFEQTVRYIEDIAIEHKANFKFEQTLQAPLFPDNEDDFNDYFIKDDNFINRNMYQRRIVGLVSYYETEKEDIKLFPKQLPDVIIRVPMSDHQYFLYEKGREIERKSEQKTAIKFSKKSREPLSTIARVFSREFSNFVFPHEIIRPFKKIKILTQEANRQKNNIELNDEEKVKSQIVVDKEILEALEKVSDPTKDYLTDEGLDIYSPKMKEMLKVVKEDEKGIILVYSSFRKIEGLEIFARILNKNGYVPYSNEQNSKDDYKRYAFYSGSEDIKVRNNLIDVITSPENKEGKNLRIILLSAAGSEGLDLKNVRKVLITEPFWHEIRIEQVIGRAVRKNSHQDLPERDRNVKVYRFFSILSDTQKERTREKISTDEYIQEIANKKQLLNNDFLSVLKDTAIDCALNQCDNDKCFGIKNTSNELSYMPNMNENIVYGYADAKEETEKEIKVVGLTKNGDLIYKDKDKYKFLNNKNYNKEPELVQKFGVDMKESIVYDYNSVKKGNLKKVGRVSKNSKFIED